jgi:hypothetical protein
MFLVVLRIVKDGKKSLGCYEDRDFDTLRYDAPLELDKNPNL